MNGSLSWPKRGCSVSRSTTRITMKPHAITCGDSPPSSRWPRRAPVMITVGSPDTVWAVRRRRPRRTSGSSPKRQVLDRLLWRVSTVDTLRAMGDRDVLAGLDEIHWAGLEHAYGSAEDVPGLLRALRSASPEERERAAYELYGNIFHQGS